MNIIEEQIIDFLFPGYSHGFWLFLIIPIE